MLIVTVILRLQPRRVESARQVLGSLAVAAQGAPGVKTFNLGEDLVTPGVFHLTEVYEDAGARERFENSKEFTAVLGALGLFFLEPPEVACYAVDTSR
ncbi:putative quinol monooxygenase [Kineobactrum salinum]|uniref:ABM domain-containing protein n=1 Tax=Kineobactrum salinum TaxID=2708301 RepID=A0A6C0U7U8_9GAMM|nr:antibiotic biosynthesis monooxygenase [Kineobactrum salinum]QIB67067.1 hypothetical protein G3T16_18380 [Kineobactrum salinum]